MNDTKYIGQLGEKVAKVHYQKLGYEFIDSNFRLKIGEIDLIFYHRQSNTLIAIEVKAKKNQPGVLLVASEKSGNQETYRLEDKIDTLKLSKIKNCLNIFVDRNPIYKESNVQVDVMMVYFEMADSLKKGTSLANGEEGATLRSLPQRITFKRIENII